MTTTTTTPARELFTFTRTGKHATCCDCCEGYCPQEDSRWGAPLDLFRIDVDGTNFLSDRYAAIREDLVLIVPDDSRVHVQDVSAESSRKFAKSAAIPDARPAESDEIFNPATIRGIYTAGYTIHQGEPSTGEKKHPQHVYGGDEHIGWVMPCVRDDGTTVRLNQVPAIAQYADEAAIHGWKVPVFDGYDPWIIAASILCEAKRIHGGHS